MSETEMTHEMDRPAPRFSYMAGLSLLWLAGMAGLVFTTLPSSTATHASVATFTTPIIAETEAPNLLTAGASTVDADAPPSETRQQASEETVDFIVRFNKDIVELDACSKIFRQDKSAAQKMFTDWAAKHEGLEELTLKKVSYSGEMILVWKTGMNRPLSKEEVQDKLSKITSISAVRYADPDYTVQAEQGR